MEMFIFEIRCVPLLLTASDMISSSIWRVNDISICSLSLDASSDTKLTESARIALNFFHFMDLDPFDDEELPPLIDTQTNLPISFNVGRTIAMPSECTTNPLQRALADSIIRMVSLDELRILFACGAKVSDL